MFDPTNYMNAPSLAWGAMLLKTKVKLELLHDSNVLHMIEKMKRGGLRFVGSQRYVKANNQHMGKDYDKDQPSKLQHIPRRHKSLWL